MIVKIARHCAARTPKLRSQAETLQHDLHKAMRSFGRQCRGHGKVFVKLVRHTERHLLELGQSIEVWSQQAKEQLAHAPHSPSMSGTPKPIM